jgi:hypothetical protein
MKLTITSPAFVIFLYLVVSGRSVYGAINPIEIDGRHFFDSVTKEPVSLKYNLTNCLKLYVLKRHQNSNLVTEIVLFERY